MESVNCTRIGRTEESHGPEEEGGGAQAERTPYRRRQITASIAVKFLLARKFDVPRAVVLYEQHEVARIREGLYDFDPRSEKLKRELDSGKFTILVSMKMNE